MIELAAAIAALTAGGALVRARWRGRRLEDRAGPGGFEAGRRAAPAPSRRSVTLQSPSICFGLGEHRLHVPLGLVVGEDAGARGCRATRSAAPGSPPSRPGRRGGCGRLRRRRPRRRSTRSASRPSGPVLAQLLLAHAAAEVRLQAGDRGQRPDAALAEFVAGGGVLEGVAGSRAGSSRARPARGCSCSTCELRRRGRRRAGGRRLRAA